MKPTASRRFASSAGYSLVELLVSMGLFTVIMGATLAGLANVMSGNDVVMNVADMNGNLRAGLDLMVRDFLQVGSGLPASHSVNIPHGTGSSAVRLPGPPGTSFTTAVGDSTLPAVIPWNSGGPVIGTAQTDVVTILMADNAFLNVRVTAATSTSLTVGLTDVSNNNIVLNTGPDRVVEGQLMLITKGSSNTLVQVTSLNYPSRVLTFANNDSLRLNQSGAEAGNLAALNALAPANDPTALNVSRIRMITYYLDTSVDAVHPRLMRRINNGDPSTFDNTLGTAVATDVMNLQIAYDISNGAGNPGNVSMTAADQDGSGACSPNPCGRTQIRKVNLSLTAQTENRGQASAAQTMRNTLTSQVSLRSMAFVDRYR